MHNVLRNALSVFSLLIAVSLVVGVFGTLSVVQSTEVSAHGINAEESFNVTNGNSMGTVDEILTTPTTTYVAGTFTTMGPYTGHGIPISTSTGQTVTPFPEANAAVRDVVSDGSGGWFIGGEFLQVGTSDRSYLAHILSNGTVDPSWVADANSVVYSLERVGSTLYVGGDFSQINGQTRNSLAALSTTTGSPTAWDPNADDDVLDIVVNGSTLYASGIFTNIGGAARNYIAALDTTVNTNQATSWDPNADFEVHDILLNGTTLYAAGTFSNIGGAARSSIAALDTTVDTNQATSWDPSSDSIVNSMALSGTTMYVGGFFTNIGGAARNYIAALDTTVDTNQATTWDPGADAEVFEVLINGSTLYVGGKFLTVGGADRSYLAALNTAVDTNNATSWDPGAGNWVEAFALDGTTLYVGGIVQSIGASIRNHLAAINTSTGQLTSWDPDVDGDVRTMVLSGSTLYIGGYFTNVGGTARNYIAAVDATTGAVTSWDPNADGAVLTMELSGSTLYVGGEFTNIGGAARSRIAALDTGIDTNQATAWDPNSNLAVNVLDVDGTTVYVGGSFTNIGGAARNRIAALDTGINTNQATAWNPNATGTPLTLVVDGNTVYVGGSIITIGGASRSRIAALDKTTGTATAWNPSANANVTTLAVDGSSVFAGGLFATIGGQSRTAIAQLDKSTGQATSWAPTLSGFVNDVALSNDHIYAGGFWFRLNDTGDGREDLARFSYTTVQFASATSSVVEATTTKNIQVTLSQAEPADVTVDYSVTGGTATGGGVDYTLADGTLTIAAGQTSANIPVSVKDDRSIEGTETVEVTLANPDPTVQLGSPSVHTLSITDNDSAQDPVYRIIGADPIETAINTSKETYSGGTADAIVLARDDNFVDAFTITPRASQANASLLLNPTDGLDPRVLAEIQRALSSPAGLIMLAGGTEALSTQVELDLIAAGYANHKRYPGTHRRETARLIANDIVESNPDATTEAFVADDRAIVDALTIGPHTGNMLDNNANPILLQPRYGTSADASLRTFVQDHPLISRVTLVGGETALPGSFASSFDNEFDQLVVDRIAGANRFETNRAVNERYFPAPTAAVLANGEKSAIIGALSGTPSADVSALQTILTALLAGRLAAGIPAPLVLVEQNNMPTPSLEYLQAHAATIGSATIMGDTSTVSEAVEAQTAVVIQ